MTTDPKDENLIVSILAEMVRSQHSVSNENDLTRHRCYIPTRFPLSCRSLPESVFFDLIEDDDPTSPLFRI